MSTRCNVIIREESNHRREVILYKHNDGHPDVMVNVLEDMMTKIYEEFSKSNVKNWISNPSKVASMVSHLSVPVMTKEVEKLIDKSNDSNLINFLMNTLLSPIPTIEPDNARNVGCDYEYTITPSEKMEKDICYSYHLEVARVSNGKKLFVISEKEYVLGGNCYGGESADPSEFEDSASDKNPKRLGRDEHVRSQESSEVSV